jgi:hypothetical protein
MAGEQAKGAMIGRTSLAAAACALALILLIAMRLAMHAPAPSLWVLLMVWALAGAMIVTLCRLPMPNLLRGPLVFGLIGSSMVLAGFADPFGARAVGKTVSDGIDAAESARELVAEHKRRKDGNVGQSMAGAHVHLDPAPGCDDGWADAINAALDSRIGGPDGARYVIAGDVKGAGGGQPRVAVAWSIASGQTAARCGITSVSGAPAGGGDTAPLIAQLAVSFGEAIRRSIATGGVACA